MTQYRTLILRVPRKRPDISSCMQNEDGMAVEDVVGGVMVGSPDLPWAALFAETARVLSY